VRRWALGIFLFLILGAIVNVAVAWALAVNVPPRWTIIRFGGPIDLERQQTPEWFVFSDSRPGATMVEVRKAPFSQGFQMPALPAWSKAAEFTTIHSPGAGELLEQARGWPYLSLHWRQSTLARRGSQLEGGIRIGGKADTALPFMVLWRGFIFNTLFYAAMLLPLGFWPRALTWRAVVEHRRSQRGLCPACAYDLRGSAGASVCPECGAAVNGIAR